MGRTREGVVFRLRVQPRSRHQEVAGARAGALVLRVTAPPEGGRANEACRHLLADLLGISPGQVEIIRGHTARDKVALVRGLEVEEVSARLKGCSE